MTCTAHVLPSKQTPLSQSAAAKVIRTLADIPREHARCRPEALAARFGARVTSYGQLDERSSRIAQALRAEGMNPGDGVAYLGKNSDEYFELLFGCAKAGVVLVPIGWRLAAEEVTYILMDSRAKVLFVDPGFAHSVMSTQLRLASIERIIVMESAMLGWPAFQSWYVAQPADDPRLACDPADPILQLYTSGTTGRPKGAQLTHYNLLVAYFGLPKEPWSQWRREREHRARPSASSGPPTEPALHGPAWARHRTRRW